MATNDLETKILATTEEGEVILYPDNELVCRHARTKVVSRGDRDLLLLGQSNHIYSMEAAKPLFKVIKAYENLPASVRCLDALYNGNKLVIAAAVYDTYVGDSVTVVQGINVLEDSGTHLENKYKKTDSEVVRLESVLNRDTLFILTRFDDKEEVHVRDKNAEVVQMFKPFTDFCTIPDKGIVSLGRYDKKTGCYTLNFCKFTPNADVPLARFRKVRINMPRYDKHLFAPIKLENLSRGDKTKVAILAYGHPNVFIYDFDSDQTLPLDLQFHPRFDAAIASNSAAAPYVFGGVVASLVFVDEEGGIVKDEHLEASANRSTITQLNLLRMPRSNLEVRVLGIGNARMRPHTTFVIQAHRPFLVDHPYNVGSLLSFANIPYSKIRDIIVTHTHGDHFEGLQDMLLDKRNDRINLYCSQETYKKIRARVETLDEGPFFPNLFDSKFNWIKLDPILPYDDGIIKIETRRNLHGDCHTLGLKFSFKGKKFGYSSDTNYIGEEKLKQKFKALEEQRANFIESGDIFRGNISQIDFMEMLSQYLLSNNLDYGTAMGKIREQQSIHWFDDCDLIFHEATTYDEKIDPGYSVHTDVKILEANVTENLRDKVFLVHIPEPIFFNQSGKLRTAEEGRVYRL